MATKLKKKALAENQQDEQDAKYKISVVNGTFLIHFLSNQNQIGLASQTTEYRAPKMTLGLKRQTRFPNTHMIHFTHFAPH